MESGKVEIICLTLFLVLVAGLGIRNDLLLTKNLEDFRQKCKERGGIPLTTDRDNLLCTTSDIYITIEKE